MPKVIYFKQYMSLDKYTEVKMFRRDLTKKGYIIRAVIMSFFYILGIIAIALSIEDEIFLMTVIGLLMCGLPFAISFYGIGKKKEDNEDVAVYQVNDDGSYYRVGGWKKFVLSLIGLVLGLVLTPINVIFYIVMAIKGGANANFDQYVQNSKELKRVTGIDCSLAALNAKTKDVRAFIQGYPTIFNNMKKRYTTLSDADIIQLGVSGFKTLDNFKVDYPTRFNEIKRKYPNLTNYNIIEMYRKGKTSDKNFAKEDKIVKRRIARNSK